MRQEMSFKKQMIPRFIIRQFYKLIRKSPLDFEMVQYWKFKESVSAKITKDKDGSIKMKLDGEKYAFPTFPRAHILFGPLSKLKHEIKNQIFNDSWWDLEKGIAKEKIIADIRRKFFGEIVEIAERMKYDMLPPESMCVSMREMYRAWTKVGGNQNVRDIFMLIMQEDDGYRMRFQWLVNYFPWWMKMFGNPIKIFEKSLMMLEHGEVIGDMKEKARLVRRIFMLMMEDKSMRDFFVKLCREVDWSKVGLAEADKYHFRGKYFKVDYPILEY